MAKLFINPDSFFLDYKMIFKGVNENKMAYTKSLKILNSTLINYQYHHQCLRFGIEFHQLLSKVIIKYSHMLWFSVVDLS